MSLEKKPFVSYTLDEDKEEAISKPLSMRINAEERKRIDALKNVLQYSDDAKVLKAGLVVLENVIQGTFGVNLMQKLCSENRRRPIIEEVKSDAKN